MGCCYSVQKTANYDMVLKLPDTNEYLQYDGNTFVKKIDINDWIKNLYQNKKYTNYIVYNDEHGDKVNGSCGHCKGILAWNNHKISWLVHSVPKFPEIFDGNTISEIPKSGLEFGQSFIYVDNIDITQFELIIHNLYSMHPAIYISTETIPKSFKLFKKKCELPKSIEIHSNIFHIAKTSNHNLDIYEHLSRYHKGQWTCRTWIRGNECNETSQVKNNKLITHENIIYKSTKDHSKYACNHEYVIIGDLNRMTTQFDRGGGGIIIKDKKLAIEVNKLFGNNSIFNYI
jgi:hypothetical protein